MTLTDHQPPPSKLRGILSGRPGKLIIGWGIGLTALLVLILIVWLPIHGLGEWSFDEVARVPHPNAGIDAVLVETNGGATTSFGYEVFILPRGKKPQRGGALASLYGAGRNENAYGANLRWDAEETLSVEYFEARFTSLQSERVTVNGHEFTISMRAGVRDPTAPPGGMLYNMQGRPER